MGRGEKEWGRGSSCLTLIPQCRTTNRAYQILHIYAETDDAYYKQMNQLDLCYKHVTTKTNCSNSEFVIKLHLHVGHAFHVN